MKQPHFKKNGRHFIIIIDDQIWANEFGTDWREMMGQKGLRFQSWVSGRILVNDSRFSEERKWIFPHAVFEGPAFFLNFTVYFLRYSRSHACYFMFYYLLFVIHFLMEGIGIISFYFIRPRPMTWCREVWTLQRPGSKSCLSYQVAMASWGIHLNSIKSELK